MVCYLKELEAASSASSLSEKRPLDGASKTIPKAAEKTVASGPGVKKSKVKKGKKIAAKPVGAVETAQEFRVGKFRRFCAVIRLKLGTRQRHITPCTTAKFGFWIKSLRFFVLAVHQKECVSQYEGVDLSYTSRPLAVFPVLPVSFCWA